MLASMFSSEVWIAARAAPAAAAPSEITLTLPSGTILSTRSRICIATSAVERATSAAATSACWISRRRWSTSSSVSLGSLYAAITAPNASASSCASPSASERRLEARSRTEVIVVVVLGVGGLADRQVAHHLERARPPSRPRARPPRRRRVQVPRTPERPASRRSIRPPRLQSRECAGDRRSGPFAGAPTRRGARVRPVGREDRALGDRPAGRQARRPDRVGHVDDADPIRRGQDDHLDLADPGTRRDRREAAALPAGAVSRPGLRPEGRRDGRRARPGGADGGDQPPLHRRHPRDRGREQPARGDGRLAPPAGKRPRARPALDHLAPLRRHGRPGAPPDGRRPRGARERLSRARPASTSRPHRR